MPIEAARLEAAGSHLQAGDFALIRTRWDERASIDTPEFWLNAPWMTAEGSVWLRQRGIKAVGFDFPQDHCIRFFLTGEKRPPLPEPRTARPGKTRRRCPRPAGPDCPGHGRTCRAGFGCRHAADIRSGV
jgi:hypothetical protein